MRPRERIIRLIILVLSRPNIYTRKELATHLEVSKKTIDEDVIEIRRAGLDFRQDSLTYRCAIIPDQSFKELEYLMPLTDEERFKITTAIDRYCGNTKTATQLKNKFSSLYDFQKLGIQALRRPELEKLDLLEAAKNKKLQVILVNYRSNSNAIKNRTVEPFHIDPEIGMVQAYDVDAKDTKHFKLNRIERILESETPWAFEHKFENKFTDVFRIADNQRETIHLEFDVYAYNALIENYPKARADILPGAKINTYDFQTSVNANFLGVTNFILGNRGHVTIIGPDSLKQHIIQEAQKIIDNIKKE